MTKYLIRYEGELQKGVKADLPKRATNGFVAWWYALIMGWAELYRLARHGKMPRRVETWTMPDNW